MVIIIQGVGRNLAGKLEETDKNLLCLLHA